MTNREKIQSMTDDELYELLGRDCICCIWQNVPCEGKKCKDGVIAWLNAEYKEEDEDDEQ